MIHEQLALEFDALAVLVLVVIGLAIFWAIVQTCRGKHYDTPSKDQAIDVLKLHTVKDSLERRERKGDRDA